MTKQGGWPPTGFGIRLRALREEKGMSQRELAELAGCNQFTVAKLERGLQEPAWPLVLALAKALGVTCLAFLNDQSGGDQQRRGPSRPPARKMEAADHGEVNPTAKNSRRGPRKEK
jgi:transcriptional regulator with XRE-family HTH domain